MKIETTYYIQNSYGIVGYISSREGADSIAKVLRRSGNINITVGTNTRTIFESKEDFLEYISKEEKE